MCSHQFVGLYMSGAVILVRCSSVLETCISYWYSNSFGLLYTDPSVTITSSRLWDVTSPITRDPILGELAIHTASAHDAVDVSKENSTAPLWMFGVGVLCRKRASLRAVSTKEEIFLRSTFELDELQFLEPCLTRKEIGFFIGEVEVIFSACLDYLW